MRSWWLGRRPAGTMPRLRAPARLPADTCTESSAGRGGASPRPAAQPAPPGHRGPPRPPLSRLRAAAAWEAPLLSKFLPSHSQPCAPTRPHAPPLGRGWLPDSAPRVAQLTPVLMAYVFQGLKCFSQTSFKILKRESTVQGTHPSRGLSRIKIWTYFLHYPIFLFFLSSLVGVLSKALGSSNASLKN